MKKLTMKMVVAAKTRAHIAKLIVFSPPSRPDFNNEIKTEQKMENKQKSRAKKDGVVQAPFVQKEHHQKCVHVWL